jgi:hypothetical protein
MSVAGLVTCKLNLPLSRFVTEQISRLSELPVYRRQESTVELPYALAKRLGWFKRSSDATRPARRELSWLIGTASVEQGFTGCGLAQADDTPPALDDDLPPHNSGDCPSTNSRGVDMGEISPSELTGELRIAVARAVASHQIEDVVLESIARRLTELPSADLIRRINVCTHGICADYFFDPQDWREALAGILQSAIRIRRFEYFPWGIIKDDLIQVRVEYQLDELVRVALPQDPVPARTRLQL